MRLFISFILGLLTSVVSLPTADVIVGDETSTSSPTTLSPSLSPTAHVDPASTDFVNEYYEKLLPAINTQLPLILLDNKKDPLMYPAGSNMSHYVAKTPPIIVDYLVTDIDYLSKATIDSMEATNVLPGDPSRIQGQTHIELKIQNLTANLIGTLSWIDVAGPFNFSATMSPVDVFAHIDAGMEYSYNTTTGTFCLKSLNITKIDGGYEKLDTYTFTITSWPEEKAGMAKMVQNFVDKALGMLMSNLEPTLEKVITDTLEKNSVLIFDTLLENPLCHQGTSPPTLSPTLSPTAGPTVAPTFSAEPVIIDDGGGEAVDDGNLTLIIIVSVALALLVCLAIAFVFLKRNKMSASPYTATLDAALEDNAPAYEYEPPTTSVN